MNLQKLHHSLLAALGCLAAAAANGAEINGTVRQAGGDAAKIVVATDLVPNVGDKVDIYFKIPGGEDEVGVGKGSVTDVSGEIVSVKITSSTGRIATGQLARFVSEKPQKKTVAQIPPAPSVPVPPTTRPPSTPPTVSVAPPTTPALPSPPTATTPKTAHMPPPVSVVTPIARIAPAAPVAPVTSVTVRRDSGPINFDAQKPGDLPANAFAARGVRFAAEKGVPQIFAAQPNMILPAGRVHVFMVGGATVTALTITFDEPIRRFGLTRIGTGGGASVPTWMLDAYDASGKVVASAGEEHGLPKTPQAFSVSDSAIVKVRLSTDNRFGNTVWATWNSLPVAEFEIER